MKKILLALAVALCAVSASAQTVPPSFPYIYYGGYATFQTTLFTNGIVYTGAAPTIVWTSNDSKAVLTPSADTLTVKVTLPTTGDSTTSLVLTATFTTPDGTVLAPTITIPCSAAPVAFTATINQTSEVGP